MKETTPWDRLLPCLFDRLIDDDTRNPLESRDTRAMSSSDYKRSVLNDLERLLNSGTLFQSKDNDYYPETQSSVLNYGVKSFTGQYFNQQTILAIESEIKKAIRQFEPRVLPESLSVRVVTHDTRDAKKHSTLNIEIAGQLWLSPYPEPLFLRTEFDLETSQFKVVR